MIVILFYCGGGGGSLINVLDANHCIQFYAPTTLVPARDFWTLGYSATLEDGSHVVWSDLLFFFFICSKFQNET